MVEDLNVAGMLRNRRLARSLADQSFGTVRHQLGYKLGQADVNIASMQVARDQPRGRAMMFLAVDGPVDARTMRRLREVEGLRGLHYVHLGRGEGG